MLAGYLNLRAGERVSVFTDSGRTWLAESIAQLGSREGLGVSIWVLDPETPRARVEKALASLDEDEVVLSILSPGLAPPAWTALLPALSSPLGFHGRSAAIRSRIPDSALIAMLSSDVAMVQERIDQILVFNGCDRLEMTTPGGTAVSFGVRQFSPLPWRLKEGCRHAFLPPSEIYTSLIEGSANGVIVVDITVGECVVEGRVLDSLGLVDQPVVLTTREGMVTELMGETLLVTSRLVFFVSISVAGWWLSWVWG